MDFEKKQDLKRQLKLLKTEKKTNLSIASEYLQNGATFIKYGRRGKPKPMHIFMFERTICWRDPRDTSLPNLKNGERQIPLRLIKEITDGRVTPVFKRFKAPEKDKFSFSLVSDFRTLDLEAPKEIEKQLFIEKLKLIMAYSRE